MNVRQINIPSTTARLNMAWQAAPQHLRPVLAAVRDHGAGMLFVSQESGAFRQPAGNRRPTIFLVGDDLDVSCGPQAFHLPSIRRAARECRVFAVIAGEPTPDVYAAVAAGAVAGASVMIVETRPEHEIQWVDLIRKLAPGRQLIWSTVRGGRA